MNENSYVLFLTRGKVKEEIPADYLPGKTDQELYANSESALPKKEEEETEEEEAEAGARPEERGDELA